MKGPNEHSFPRLESLGKLYDPSHVQYKLTISKTTRRHEIRNPPCRTADPTTKLGSNPITPFAKSPIIRSRGYDIRYSRL